MRVSLNIVLSCIWQCNLLRYNFRSPPFASDSCKMIVIPSSALCPSSLKLLQRFCAVGAVLEVHERLKTTNEEKYYLQSYHCKNICCTMLIAICLLTLMYIIIHLEYTLYYTCDIYQLSLSHCYHIKLVYTYD